MHFREYRDPVIALAASNRANVPKPVDPLLGSVAVGSMLLILASVITGIEFLAIFALLIALVYVRVAGSLESSKTSFSAAVERWQAGVAPHALRTAARSRRRSAYDGLAN